MPVIRLIGCQRTAAAQVELSPNQLQRVAQRTGIGEGPEVSRPVLLFQTRQGETRNRIIQIYLQQQEPFVIAKTDIVSRMKFFDELAFEQKSFGFGTHQVEIKIMNSFHQRLEFEVPTHSSRQLKILVHSFARSGFADINHRPEAVAHQVMPGLEAGR